MALPHGMALSDDFAAPLALGAKWSFFRPAPDEAARGARGGGALHLAGKGTRPVQRIAAAADRGRHLATSFECDIELAPGGTAGLVLFYDDKLYCGLGFDAARFVTHQYGIERARPANPHGGRMRMRVTNRRHIVSFHTSGDGGSDLAAVRSRDGSIGLSPQRARRVPDAAPRDSMPPDRARRSSATSGSMRWTTDTLSAWPHLRQALECSRSTLHDTGRKRGFAPPDGVGRA